MRKGITICEILMLCSTSWGATIGTVRIPDWELLKINAAIERNIKDPTLKGQFTKLLIAIRIAENGEQDRCAFGIKRAGVQSFDSQAGNCAVTVRNNWERWNRTDRELPFIVFLGNRYAPIGAKNDPEGKNQYWVKNVVRALRGMGE